MPGALVLTIKNPMKTEPPLRTERQMATAS